MTRDANILRDEMFSDFEIKVKDFYNNRQQRYFDDLRDKVDAGSFDFDDPGYKDAIWREAEQFMDTRQPELLEFIRDYIDKNLDIITNSLKDETMDKEDAAVAFEVLKHILLAGEADAKKR